MTQRRKPSRSSAGTPKRASAARKQSSGKGVVRKPTAASNRRPATANKSSPSLKRATVAASEPTDYNDLIQKHKKWLQGDNVFVLESPWEARLALQTFGAKYHAGLKIVTYQSGNLKKELEPYKSKDYSLARWIEDDLNPKPRPVEKASSFMKPRPHQEEAIRKIARSAKAGWRGFVLADNVGVGKTIPAIIGASITAKLRGFTKERPAKLLIICPKSVIPHWRNTIKAAGVDNLRIMILNYDQSKNLLNPPASVAGVKKQKTKNAHTLAKGTPSIKWDIIVADESHKLKNVSQRTAAFGRIARYAATSQSAPFVIWCSATIGQSPLELIYLAPLIGQMHGIKLNQSNWGDWLMENRFSITKSAAGNYRWVTAKKDATPDQKAEVNAARARDIKRLSEIIFNPKAPSIRRNPEEINGWPKQTMIAVPQTLENDEKRLYNEIWNQFRSYLNLNPRGRNPKGGLAATLRFRQKASLIRAPHTVDYADDLLDNGAQVIISVEFIETIDYLSEALGKRGYKIAEFSGRNVSEREAERLKFQKGEAQVMIFTVTEGISLHSSELLPDGTKATSNRRETIIHDVRYSGLDAVQIMGRGTREGKLANSHFMYAEDTVEPRILEIVLDKVKNMKTLSADEQDTIEEISSLLETVLS